MTTKVVSQNAAASIGGEFSSDDEAEVYNNRKQQRAKVSSINIDSLGDVNASSFDLNDEQILEMLDRFKIEHGPIADSTRNLYKKVLIKHLRDQQASKNEPSYSQKHPEIYTNPTDVVTEQQMTDVYSSDEDDIVVDGNRTDPPSNDSSAINAGNLYNNEKLSSSDSLNDQGIISRKSSHQQSSALKQLDPHPTYKPEYYDDETDESTDEDDDDGKFDETEDEEWNAMDDKDGEEQDMDVDLVSINKEAKHNKDAGRNKNSKTSKSYTNSSNLADKTGPRIKVTPMRPVTAKSSQQTAAESITITSTKKPFTRSQRAAASSVKSATTTTTSSDSVTNATKKSSFFFNYKSILTTLLVVIVAIFVAYHFRTRLTKSAERISTINFKNFNA